jgi:hypothetical protein
MFSNCRLSKGISSKECNMIGSLGIGVIGLSYLVQERSQFAPKEGF